MTLVASLALQTLRALLSELGRVALLPWVLLGVIILNHDHFVIELAEVDMEVEDIVWSSGDGRVLARKARPHFEEVLAVFHFGSEREKGWVFSQHLIRFSLGQLLPGKDLLHFLDGFVQIHCGRRIAIEGLLVSQMLHTALM